MKNQAMAPKQAKASSDIQTLTLLTFEIAGQDYALPVTDVVRIIEMVTLTHLPNAPDAIQGIINLQGKAIPVMDLRRRFGLPPQDYGLHTPIILTDVDQGSHTLGLIVDEVAQVIEIDPEQIEQVETIVPTELAEQMAAKGAHLTGVANVDRHMMLVLNIQALLTPLEQASLFLALNDKETGLK